MRQPKSEGRGSEVHGSMVHPSRNRPSHSLGQRAGSSAVGGGEKRFTATHANMRLRELGKNGPRNLRDGGIVLRRSALATDRTPHSPDEWGEPKDAKEPERTAADRRRPKRLPLSIGTGPDWLDQRKWRPGGDLAGRQPKANRLPSSVRQQADCLLPAPADAGARQKASCVERWCPGRDSNPHALRRGILSPLRLPISPPGRWRAKNLDDRIAGRRRRIGSQPSRDGGCGG